MTDVLAFALLLCVLLAALTRPMLQKRTVHPHDAEIMMNTSNIHVSGQHSPRAGRALDVR